jgi:glycosyltransferase involved in cell wall biosynthesis
MIRRIYVNGRFNNQSLTGVQRYAHEVTRRLENKITILKPNSSASIYYGHFWEQIVLPTIIGRNALLWSPTNTGPLAVFNQVVTIHDLSPIEHPEWFDRKFSAWYRFLIPRLVRSVKVIITDSEFSRSRIISRLGVRPEKVVVIPLGVGENFEPAPKDRIDEVCKLLGINSPYFLFVGSLEPRKNLNRLFIAWQRVHTIFPDHKLVVTGGEGHTFRDKGFENIPPGVVVTDYVPDRGLPALYSGAKALLFPSLYEGFGLPALESMACGVPVVASNTTSLPEVVGDAGILIDPLCIEDMIDAIQKVISHGALREELRRKGMNRARDFSWDKTVELVWSLLTHMSE